MKQKLFLLFPFLLLSALSSAGASPCEESFSEPIKQLKHHLLALSPNKEKGIQNLSVTSCGENCFSLSSKTHIQFQIKIDPLFSSPEITVSSSRKTLKIPSLNHLENSDLFKVWLIGHEVHPQTPPSDTIQYTTAQETAFKAASQAILEGAGSFLHIAPTGTGKTLVMARTLKENLSPGLHFVTAHQIHLVDQLHKALQYELKGTGTFIINWNEKNNSTFSEEVEQATSLKEPVVFVVTSQTLKKQLNLLENKKPEIYKKLVENTQGIYLDEAHHLGAFHTKKALLKLKDQSRAFFYGATATPVHKEVNIRGLFAREHWSYLNGEENLFRTHSADKTLEQLSLAIRKGEVTPFDDLYVIGESKNFNVTKEQPLFIQGSSDLYVLNPYYYKRLAGILHPILEFNRKGFIVTATIAEADRLTGFLNEVFEDVEFEAYHSELTREERLSVLKRSQEREFHYIVAVRALDEGVNLPHLSAYIDLNSNVSVKQMVHRIGRVLRLYPGKAGAGILFLADYKDAKKAGDLLNLLEVVESSPGFSGGVRHPSGDRGLKSYGVTPLTREELLELRRELESSVRSFWSEKVKTRPSLDEAKQLVRKKRIKLKREFLERRKTDTELQLIPSNPSQTYKDEAWVDWPDFLGTTKVPLNEATQIVRKKRIKLKREFWERRKTDPELQLIPSNPDQTYKDEGWLSWPDFLGTNFVTLNEAKQLVRKKRIKLGPEFWERRKTDPELQFIPSNPDQTYKDEGWLSWPDFLGTTKITLNEATQIVRKKGIKTSTEFNKRRKTDPELQLIPSNPPKIYKDEAWVSWPDFLGTNWVTLNEATEIVRKKGIKTSMEFRERRKTDPELQLIPSHPEKTYKDEAWVSWPDFLGTNWVTLNEATQIVRKKGIKTSMEFRERRKTDPELQLIPSNPDQTYKDEAWVSWPDFLGTK